METTGKAHITNTQRIRFKIQTLGILENSLAQNGVQPLAALLSRLQNLLRIMHHSNRHLEQVDGDVVVHGHQRVPVQLRKIGDGEHDSVQF